MPEESGGGEGLIRCRDCRSDPGRGASVGWPGGRKATAWAAGTVSDGRGKGEVEELGRCSEGF